MEFYEYQLLSRDTWIPKSKNIDEFRCVLGICGEAGELAEKYKKFLRGDNELNEMDIIYELGDILYYVARLCDYTQLTLNDIAKLNIEKLQNRKERNKIKGNGDSR